MSILISLERTLLVYMSYRAGNGVLKVPAEDHTMGPLEKKKPTPKGSGVSVIVQYISPYTVGNCPTSPIAGSQFCSLVLDTVPNHFLQRRCPFLANSKGGALFWPTVQRWTCSVSGEKKGISEII